MNKTCFNGIWRVNASGEFNVPYGHKEPPSLPTRENLINASSALENATLKVEDFREILADAEAGDFVYLDPPYPPFDGSSGFNRYTRERFGRDDQEDVADTMRALDERGCRVSVSNVDTDLVRRLFEGFTIKELSALRSVSASGERYPVQEVVILNYDPPLQR